MLILIGVLLGLSLSAGVTWAESEAGLYASQNGDTNLNIQCPLMLAPDEPGVVRAKIVNLTNEEVKPVVSAEISHNDIPRTINQTVVLSPRASHSSEWTVDSSDVIFGNLILVNILQARYRDNPSMLGACGIVLFNLFGLTGLQTFSLVLILSLVAMSLGAILWKQAHPLLNNFSRNLERIGKVVMTISVLALLTTFPRWWGLTLVLDLLIVLIMGITFTDFVLFSQKYKY